MDVLHEKLTKIKEIRYRMKKIMFNDRYGLTQAVIKGRKTMTRRMISGSPLLPADHIEEARYFADFIQIVANDGETLLEVKSRYKVGEVVAVAQRYQDIFDYSNCVNPYAWEDDDKPSGWTNKMLTKAELMPHQIRITGIKCERLQDISDAECMKEGVVGGIIGYYVPGIKCKDWSKESYVDTEDGRTWKLFPTPREAFASLIDKVSGLGAWQRNPWVVAYEFELVK
mgnify:CR=1 FL=1